MRTGAWAANVYGIIIKGVGFEWRNGEKVKILLDDLCISFSCRQYMGFWLRVMCSCYVAFFFCSFGLSAGFVWNIGTARGFQWVSMIAWWVGAC